MGFQISKAHTLMSEGLDGRALRQKIISGNIANADTPFYKAKDVDFETALIEKSNELYRNKTKILELAKTDSLHLEPVSDFDPAKATIYFRDGHLTRNDANNVDIDIESTEMSKNSIMFNALSSALRKDSMLFKSVIDASSKVQ